MQPLFVHSQVSVGEHAFDDLAKGQGHDGQIVAVEAQHWDADEEPEEAGQGGADHHGHARRTGVKGISSASPLAAAQPRNAPMLIKPA